MRVIFRADASVDIGAGHVMRCLTLADALTRQGAHCRFLCRPGPGDMNDIIQERGYQVHSVPSSGAHGLAPAWEADAAQCQDVLNEARADWLVLDHYGLGCEWERTVRPTVGRLLAIDDLGRSHHCDVLLDQNYENPTHARYRLGTEGNVVLLLGATFALVRPEFSALRHRAVNRRVGARQRLLLTMGGSDPADETSKVIGALSQYAFRHWQLDVVVGASNPNRQSVEAACSERPNTCLHVQTSEMAELMTEADLAITSGGGTSWERCCLGLPALVTILSPDQEGVSAALAAAGAQVLVGWSCNLVADDYRAALAALTPQQLREMSAIAATVCDGGGAARVAERMLS
jgi:UDP-2,4-diacetamido-2,4,6-trideoxy-beta-L-altropyranose hydrolase